MAREIRPFGTLLSEMISAPADPENGRPNPITMAEALADELALVVQAVEETRKKGKLTLHLHVQPFGDADGAIVVVPEVAAKIPQPTKQAKLYFASDDGGLYQNDPRQGQLRLGPRTIDHPPLDDAEDGEENAS